MRAGMGVLLAFASAVAHAGAAPGPARAPQAQPPSQPRLVCTSERVTGSHIRKRTCVTEEEAEERRKSDREAMERMKGPVQPNDIGR